MEFQHPFRSWPWRRGYLKTAFHKAFLAGTMAAMATLLSAPFVIKAVLTRLQHANLKPYLAAHDVNFFIPWGIGLAAAFLVLALAAFLVAFDISFSRSQKSQDR